MNITADTVKQLRERTGAGMMECKKALVETKGDLDAAAELMRKTGLAKADKKATRVAAEGTVAVERAGNSAVLVEVNCETDFVARSDEFLAFVRELARVTAPGVLGTYIHGGRKASLVALKGGDEALAKDLAMHVVAANPAYIDSNGVPAAVLDKEREILAEQTKGEKKPPEIIAKMVEGRLRKHLAEITLVGQPFVKDPDVTVEKLLKKAGATVVQFERYEVGDGIEKKQDDFVGEVMAQVKAQEKTKAGEEGKRDGA